MRNDGGGRGPCGGLDFKVNTQEEEDMFQKFFFWKDFVFFFGIFWNELLTVVMMTMVVVTVTVTVTFAIGWKNLQNKNIRKIYIYICV